jgi:predicted NAD/FAD-dependent oxidoreductase
LFFWKTWQKLGSILEETRATQGVAYAPEWEVVCGYMEDIREKWNMVKVDDPQLATKKLDQSTQEFIR